MLSRLPSANGGFNYALSDGVPMVKKKRGSAAQMTEKNLINLIIFYLRKRCGGNGSAPLLPLTADSVRYEETPPELRREEGWE